MWWNHVLRQMIQITAFSGHVSHRAADMGTGWTKDKRIARRGKQTVQATLGQKASAVKRWKRPGKDNRRQNTKKRQNPKRHEWGPARGGGGEPPHPLAKKSPHLVKNTDNRKLPKRGDWIMTERETSSHWPDQKKEKAREESSFATQAGMWIKEATYHTQERARAWMTRAWPQKDRGRECHDLRTWSTASIQGCQLSSSKSPIATKTPRTFILKDDQSRTTGGSEWPHQPHKDDHMQEMEERRDVAININARLYWW